jgi:iron complex outermembrane receptor protein
MVRAEELASKTPLIFIPPDRFQTGLSWAFRGGKFFHKPTVELSGVYCRKQDRVPAGLDYADSPAAWAMLNAELSSEVVLGKFRMDVGISAFNLSNTRYRDYLNRFRYFADEMGRNYSIRIKIPF